MIDKMLRQTIITLHQSGKSCRHISQLLHVSRNTVKKVLIEGVEPPLSDSKNSQDELSPIIKVLFERVAGNVVRIQEILKSDYHQEIAYSTLTRLIMYLSQAKRCSMTLRRIVLN